MSRSPACVRHYWKIDRPDETGDRVSPGPGNMTAKRPVPNMTRDLDKSMFHHIGQNTLKTVLSKLNNYFALPFF